MKTLSQRVVVTGLIIISLSAVFLLTDFQLSLVTEMLIAGLFALSLNLLLGLAGMVSFGHAAYYGAGAYAVAILTTNYQVHPLLALLVAPFISAAVALVLGWLCVRLTDLYFSILTLAFGQMLYILALQGSSFTGGDNGILAIPVPDFLQTDQAFYIFTLVVVASSIGLIAWLRRTPFALTLRAIRDNSERVAFIGVNKQTEQLKLFVIAGALAGLAGGLIALHHRLVAVDMLAWTTSAEPLLGSLLGGMYTLLGPLFGGGLLVLLESVLVRITVFWPFVLGSVTIAAVLLAPEGLLGMRWSQWRKR